MKTVNIILLVSLIFLGVQSNAITNNDNDSIQIKCLITKKRHYLKDEKNVYDDPNDIPPGKPGSSFIINQNTGKISGFNSELGNFDNPGIMHQSKVDNSSFVYFSNEKNGVTPVLYVTIFESTIGVKKNMSATIGRLLFSGECIRIK